MKRIAKSPQSAAVPPHEGAVSPHFAAFPRIAPVPAVARAAMAPRPSRPHIDFLAVDQDPFKLHPMMRSAAAEVIRQCQAEKLPFKVYEGYRFPRRQSQMFLDQRSKYGAWQSYHNYGLAADFVLFLEGKWVWANNSLYDHLWQRLQEIGELYGLETIEGERPHLQVATLELSDLMAGRYPGGGDQSWERTLAIALEDWPITDSEG